MVYWREKYLANLSLKYNWQILYTVAGNFWVGTNDVGGLISGCGQLSLH